MKISIKPPQNKKPVFSRSALLLVGMIRCGSNYLEHQLNRLPETCVLPAGAADA